MWTSLTQQPAWRWRCPWWACVTAMLQQLMCDPVSLLSPSKPCCTALWTSTTFILTSSALHNTDPSEQFSIKRINQTWVTRTTSPLHFISCSWNRVRAPGSPQWLSRSHTAFHQSQQCLTAIFSWLDLLLLLPASGWALRFRAASSGNSLKIPKHTNRFWFLLNKCFFQFIFYHKLNTLDKFSNNTM